MRARARRRVRPPAALLVATLLAGCAVFGRDEPPPPCPKVAFIYGLHAVDALPIDGERVPVRAELAGIRGRCTYDDGRVELDYSFDVYVRPTAVPASGRVKVPYFVAVLDDRGEVVDRQRFVAEVPVAGPGERTGLREHLRQTLLQADRSTGPAHRILIGLDLPPDAALASWQNRDL